MSRIVSLSDLQGFYVNSLAFMLEERLSFECEMGEFVRNLQHYLEVVFSTPRCYHPMLLAALGADAECLQHCQEVVHLV